MSINYGDMYPGSKNLPSGLRVIMAIGEDQELTDVTNDTDAYVDRESLTIERTNDDGSSATLTFDLILPSGAYLDIPANRYVHVDDPNVTGPNGGALAYFAGYTMQPSTTKEAMERRVSVQCVDYGVLAQKPPKQIITDWPPGDGTPVVDASVALSLDADANGEGVAVRFTPQNLRNLYIGKKVYAQNSDADPATKERITITDINYAEGWAEAIFTTDKTSTTTTVQGALHAVGLQWVTPDSMTNINVGSVVYCQKHHGVQDVGNEWVVVEQVGETGTEHEGMFAATYTSWKTHGWEVRSYWYLAGGVTDKELIADGFKMHVDLLDESGNTTTSLVDVEGLLDHCFNNEGITVDKTGVSEINLSLPHGRFEAMTPEDVLNWIRDQNADLSVEPHWYMSFVQPAAEELSTLVPMLRWYDSKASTWLAGIGLTDQIAEIDTSVQARFTEYQAPEDGTNFANKQTVLGSLGSVGSYTDDDSVSNSLAVNYVGRVIEAKPVVLTELTTNEQCTAKAKELMEVGKLSMRRRAITVSTYAQLDPSILYEPQLLRLYVTWEGWTGSSFEVKRASLSFADKGLAKYQFTLGDPITVKSLHHGGQQKLWRGAAVSVAPTGKVSSAGPRVTKYLYTSSYIDNSADNFVCDASEEEVHVYLPPTSSYPGFHPTITAQDVTQGPVVIHPYQQYGVTDTVDGLNEVSLVRPGQSITLQSAGEWSPKGRGARWHSTASVIGEGGGQPWVQGGNSFGATGVIGTNDLFDLYFRTNGIDRFSFSSNDGTVWHEADSQTAYQNWGFTTGIYQLVSNTNTFGIDVAAAGCAPDTGTHTQIVGLRSTAWQQYATTVNEMVGLWGALASYCAVGGTVHVAKAVTGQAAYAAGNAIEKVYSIYGEKQTVGTQENWSGYFVGDIGTEGKAVFKELGSSPATPGPDLVDLYAKDNGSGVSCLYWMDDDGTEHDLSATVSGLTNPYDVSANTMEWTGAGAETVMSFHQLGSDDDYRLDIDLSRGATTTEIGYRPSRFFTANARLEIRDDVASNADVSGIFIDANVQIQPHTPVHTNALNLNTALLLRTGPDYANFDGDLLRVYDEENGIEVFNIWPNGDVYTNRNLITTSTEGFFHIPGVDGTPTGVPTPPTGLIPMVYDYAHQKLYVYDAGWVSIN